MLLQELTENEITIQILIGILAVLGFIILIIIMELHTYFSRKIHDNYHKGYNKAKDDKVQYYKTIKELIDSFKIILSELYKDNSKLSIITAQLLIDFKVSLQEYYSN